MREIATTHQEVGMKEIATGDRRARLLRALDRRAARGRGGLRGHRRERAGQAAGDRDDHGQHAADRERAADGSRDQEGLLRRAGDRDQQADAPERQRRRARAPEQQRRDRLPRLGADVHRPHAGDRAHRGRRERGRGHERGRQLAEHPRQGLELDPHACRPGGQDGRRERAQGRRRGDDQGGAEEGQRRPRLGPPARAAVPGDALGAPERPGRRDLDPRAVPEPGARATAGGS